MDQTKIEWADRTFGGWSGCEKVSAACKNCYAEKGARRNPGILGVWGKNGTRPIRTESYWRKPLKWNKEAQAEGRQHRVFCASYADVFEDRPDLVAPRNRTLDLINKTPWLIWMLLTKRPETMLAMTRHVWPGRWQRRRMRRKLTAASRSCSRCLPWYAV